MPTHDVDEGRLARAVGTQEPENFTTSYLDINSSESLYAAKAFPHADGAQQYGARFGCDTDRLRIDAQCLRRHWTRLVTGPFVPPGSGFADDALRQEERHDDEDQSCQALSKDRIVATGERQLEQRDRSRADDG